MVSEKVIAITLLPFINVGVAHITIMPKLTHTQKELLSEETQVMIEAGFLTADLKITDDLRHFLTGLTFSANMAKVVKRAKEKIAEQKKDCKPCKDKDEGGAE